MHDGLEIGEYGRAISAEEIGVKIRALPPRFDLVLIPAVLGTGSVLLYRAKPAGRGSPRW